MRGCQSRYFAPWFCSPYLYFANTKFSIPLEYWCIWLYKPDIFSISMLKQVAFRRVLFTVFIFGPSIANPVFHCWHRCCLYFGVAFNVDAIAGGKQRGEACSWWRGVREGKWARWGKNQNTSVQIQVFKYKKKTIYHLVYKNENVCICVDKFYIFVVTQFLTVSCYRWRHPQARRRTLQSPFRNGEKSVTAFT